MSCLECKYLQRSVLITQNEKDSWVTTQTEYNCAIKSENFHYNLQQSLEGNNGFDCSTEYGFNKD